MNKAVKASTRELSLRAALTPRADSPMPSLNLSPRRDNAVNGVQREESDNEAPRDGSLAFLVRECLIKDARPDNPPAQPAPDSTQISEAASKLPD